MQVVLLGDSQECQERGFLGSSAGCLSTLNVFVFGFSSSVFVVLAFFVYMYIYIYKNKSSSAQSPPVLLFKSNPLISSIQPARRCGPIG